MINVFPVYNMYTITFVSKEDEHCLTRVHVVQNFIHIGLHELRFLFYLLILVNMETHNIIVIKIFLYPMKVSQSLKLSRLKRQIYGY